MTWVYWQSERVRHDDGYVSFLYTVGFYDPSGICHTDSDHSDKEEAAKRTAWLNGSKEAIE